MSKEEIRKNAVRNSKKSSKKIIILKNEKCLNMFISASELDKQSEKLFGIKLDFRVISAICNNKRKQYKGYTFKFVSNLTNEEYVKYDIETRLKENTKLNQAI